MNESNELNNRINSPPPTVGKLIIDPDDSLNDAEFEEEEMEHDEEFVSAFDMTPDTDEQLSSPAKGTDGKAAETIITSSPTVKPIGSKKIINFKRLGGQSLINRSSSSGNNQQDGGTSSTEGGTTKAATSSSSSTSTTTSSTSNSSSSNNNSNSGTGNTKRLLDGNGSKLAGSQQDGSVRQKIPRLSNDSSASKVVTTQL